MIVPVTRRLADKLTNGGVSALARLLGINLSTVKRINNGRITSEPVLELLLEILNMLSSRIGPIDAREMFLEAARRLGRNPEDKRSWKKGNRNDKTGKINRLRG